MMVCTWLLSGIYFFIIMFYEAILSKQPCKFLFNQAGDGLFLLLVRWLLFIFICIGIGVQDIATRVIAEGLRVEQTIMSKIMTRNPTYVMSDSLAIEALQKMVQGMSSEAFPLIEFIRYLFVCTIWKQSRASVFLLFSLIYSGLFFFICNCSAQTICVHFFGNSIGYILKFLCD